MLVSKQQILSLQQTHGHDVDADFPSKLIVIDSELSSIHDRATYMYNNNLNLHADNSGKRDLVHDINKMLQPFFVDLFLLISLYAECVDAQTSTGNRDYKSVYIPIKIIPSTVGDQQLAQRIYQFLKNAILKFSRH